MLGHAHKRDPNSNGPPGPLYLWDLCEKGRVATLVLRRILFERWCHFWKRRITRYYEKGEWYKAPSSVSWVAAGYGPIGCGPTGIQWSNREWDEW